MRTSGRTKAGALLFALVTAVAGCTNTPPPPVVTSPVAETDAPQPDETASQIVVGVDEIAGGYNPHNLADTSTITSALSQMLLPSVFRPGDEGERVLDESLMTSASVISQDPFTVAYEIRPDASWSDGAPIAVEDFAYLADAMKNQPGVVDPAGYRLISGIEPGQGGKRVEVTFTEPYPAWRTLFDNLLPSHLLKDAPGGWQGALADSFPAYGGPFAIKTLDNARGEIVLERNERYWEKPAAVDRIVLRRIDGSAMAGALSGGTAQFTLSTTDGTEHKLLESLGADVQLHTVARPVTAEVLLRPASPTLADDQVRAAVATLIDRDALIAEGTAGGPSARLRADAQVRPPSSAGYAATKPKDRAARAAERLLAQAGYTRQAGTWRREGEPLSLVIAAPGQREPYASIAKVLARQLMAAGIEVNTVNPPSRELFADQLAMPVTGDGTIGAGSSNGAVPVDIAVVPQSAGGDPATNLASAFGCGPGWDEDESGDGGNSGDTARAPANPAAFCAEGMQPEIEAALTGERPADAVLAELEPALWQENVAIPLFQLADTLAIGSGVLGVTPGAPLTGPFSSAVNWTRGNR
ncbi:ABC-type transport system substrate-binding protein [Prauserella shujinwangii]|uniref:ABC-type transport system substrate-binding protein n=1 Tax=Prauserella shujinwangii TaxID=1453103 RepID=A0A2T0LY46_9PSEU|nr:ABC transporter family substrate-binding protein [Prauserella shujinwangii]PRX49027.1 ABC-type transport system substrate-binding protein [Prauserella shujinwangii]